MAKVISSTLEIEAKFKLDEEDYFTFKKSIIQGAKTELG